MKKVFTLFSAAMMAVAGVANAQQINKAEVKAQAVEAQAELCMEKRAERVAGSAIALPQRAKADGVYYHRPAGTFFAQFTRYNEESGSTTDGAYATYYSPVLSVPSNTDLEFVNKSTDADNSLWGFNSQFFTREERPTYYSGNNHIGAYYANGTYYVPQVKVSDVVYTCGEEADANQYIATDSITALCMEMCGRNVSVYSGFSGGVYGFGSTSDNYDFNKDGVAEPILCDGLRLTCPKPAAPLSFDYIFIPAISHTEFFKNGAKIDMTIYGLTENAEGKLVADTILFEASCGDGDFTNGVYSTSAMANLKFEQKITLPNGMVFSQPVTINQPYLVEITGFAHPDVDLGFRFTVRPEVEREIAPKIYEMYNDSVTGKYLGDLSYNTNPYGLALNFHGMYDVIQIADNYIASDSSEMKDINVLQFDATGSMETCRAGNSRMNYLQVYTQISWYDSEDSENYYIEGLEDVEWIEEYLADASEYADYDVTLVSFKLQPLPAGVTGRGERFLIRSTAFDGPSDNYCYVLQGDYTKEQVDAQYTAIATVKADAKAARRAYNLAGQEVNAEYKGLVIEEGKVAIRL